MLFLLLNTQTKSIILDETLDVSCVEEFPSFLSKIVESAPNLETLSMVNLWAREEITLSPKKTAILTSIAQLNNLKELGLVGDIALNDDDLMLVTEKHKNLVCLKVHTEVFP